MAEQQTFSARWIFPVSHDPIENGTITIAGAKILSIDAKGARLPDDDLGNVAIIPGLVNCHTHLDLGGARGVIPPTDPEHFTDWLKGVIAFRRCRTPEQTQADIRDGLAESLRHGTTLIGDIAAGGASWDALATAPIRSVVFHEFIGMTRAAVNAALTACLKWTNERNPTNTTRPGISPHAPYSVSRKLAASLRIRALFSDFPHAVHFGETLHEYELLAKHSGPFREFLEELKIWRKGSLSKELSSWIFPVTRSGPDLIVHANYVAPTIPIQSNASVIYCPRTHAAFRHPPHPFREFQTRGVRVALGTDSLASNPDLDILAEARFLHHIRPEVPLAEFLRMITLSGAEALGWADETGSLDPVKSADFVALPLPDREAADPYDLIFGEDFPYSNRRTMFRGEWRSI